MERVADDVDDDVDDIDDGKHELLDDMERVAGAPAADGDAERDFCVHRRGEPACSRWQSLDYP